MKEVQDRVVQFSNRYKLTDVDTGEVLGTFDFDEETGTVQQVGTEIDKELFDSIANDIAARVKLSGGELSRTIVTFSDISETAANVASGDTSATLWGKVKNWFSRLKALAFKDTIRNADVASNAAIAQSKISGLADSLAAKQNTITGAASTIATHNLTDNRALVSNESGKVGVSAVTATELGYLDGVTSNVQTQLNRKYVKPSGGIPASDLAQAVQTSLDKANSALQSAPVTSVNGKTGAVNLTAANIGAAAASDLNAYLPLTGGTLTGNLTGQYITGSWLQATAANHQTSAASKIAVFDGSGWLYYRTSAELLSDIGAATESYVDSQIAAAITTALNTAV